MLREITCGVLLLTLATISGCANEAATGTAEPSKRTDSGILPNPAEQGSKPDLGGADKPVAPRPTGAPGPPATPGVNAPLAATPEEDAAVKAAEASGDKQKLVVALISRASRHSVDDKAGVAKRFGAVLQDAKHALKLDPENKRASGLIRYAEARMPKVKK